MRPPAHLLHTHDNLIGYSRKRSGKKFTYFNENGRPIKQASTIERLNKIGIPPAWTKVWICKDENGCLQASGRDERGRKQYIYHPDWVTYRNLDKFQNLLSFGKKLPHIRKVLKKDIYRHGWPKEKVLALALSIIDVTYMRIGNQRYRKQNNTYGLTTLRRRHLSASKAHIEFSYVAKWSKQRKVKLTNRTLVKLIKECAELPGHELFHYMDAQGKSHQIHSHDVNDYLNQITREQAEHFTAKDFRTWGGSVTALEVLKKAKAEVEDNPRKSLIRNVICHVSRVLGNTEAICRKYYIHPAVISAIENGNSEEYLALTEKLSTHQSSLLNVHEKQLLILLEEFYKK
ncbi:MAG: topoisomerase [Gammaproteobacteria bacterium]|jgi:DNA topoisomerase-1|nr:topoisomerase [Gammaproteobacteria bacterium]